MEQRVHELEAELEAEQLRHAETVKAIRKQVLLFLLLLDYIIRFY